MSGLERGQKATGPERGRPGRSRPLESHVPGEEGGHVYYVRRGIEMQQEERQGGSRGESNININTWDFLQWLKTSFVQSSIAAGRVEAKESPGMCIVSLVFLIPLIRAPFMAVALHPFMAVALQYLAGYYHINDGYLVDTKNK